MEIPPFCRCSSYWKRWNSIAMLVCQRVSASIFQSLKPRNDLGKRRHHTSPECFDALLQKTRFKLEHFATRIEFHCLKGFKNLFLGMTDGQKNIKKHAPPDQKTPRAPTWWWFQTYSYFYPEIFGKWNPIWRLHIFQMWWWKSYQPRKPCQDLPLFYPFFLTNQAYRLRLELLIFHSPGVWSQCRCTSKWPCRWWNRLLQICRKQFRNQIVCRWQCFYLFFCCLRGFAKDLKLQHHQLKRANIQGFVCHK